MKKQRPDALEARLGRLHGGVLVMLVLAEEQEVLPNLVLGERGRVALEMLGELADVADVLFFCGRPIIFKLDELLELGDRRMVKFNHRRERMPLSEGKTARQI